MTTLKSNKDDAVFVSIPEEQGAGETDWIRYKGRFKGAGKILGIDSGSTTNTQLSVFDHGISQGDTIYIQEGVDTSVKSVEAGAVVGNDSDTGTLDIFSDGSTLATYQFNDDSTDLSGNYNGTWTGTEQYGVGKFGQAALFDGSSQIDTGISTYQSLSFWVYLSSVTARHGILRAENGTIFIDADTSLWWQGNGPDNYDILDNAPLTANTWHHVVFNKNSNTIFIDGTEYTTTRIASGSTYTTNLTLGLGYNSTRLLSGSKIDQVRVFYRILTQSDVDALYAEAAPYSQIDISSASLTNAPTKAVLKTPNMSICLETEPRRCISQDFIIPVISAFNDTLVTNLPQLSNIPNSLATYQFNGDSTDLSGNYNGTWTGAEQYGTGKFGQAALFNGSSHIDSTVQPPAADTTVSLWVNLASVSPAFQVIVSCSTNELLVQGGLLRLISSGAASSAISQQINLSTSVWYHVVFDGLGNCYVDGVLQTPGASEGFTAQNIPLKISGRSNDGNYDLSNGSLIDQVRVFDRILTQSDVDALYAESPTKDCLDAGDQVKLTVDGSPVTTEVLTMDKTTPGEYTFTFAAQPSPPTAAVVPRRDTQLTNPVPVGNWDGDLMTLEYDRVTQVSNPGRAIQYRIDADTDYQVTQVNIDLGKQE